MIFATIGTTKPFDRLLHALEAIEEELIVQCGDSAVRPANASTVSYLPYDELVAHVRRARVVVAHAGVGTIMTALANGQHPVVVPRRAVHGEAIDDHQLELGRRLHALGVVTLVEDPALLSSAVANHAGLGRSRAMDSPKLVTELRAFVEEAVTRPRMRVTYS